MTQRTLRALLLTLGLVELACVFPARDVGELPGGSTTRGMSSDEPGDSDSDSDDDGLGNECDPCRQSAQDYNNDGIGISGYMRVRNTTIVADTDGDGIGDAGDNCVRMPNCEQYGPDSPWRPGDPIAYDDAILCQFDSNNDMVGDACEGQRLDRSAGPVGLGPDDDFDQDGLRNVDDACPRMPVSATIPCDSDDECPTTRRCETSVGQCDHLDQDGDGVGDQCDSGPAEPNAAQAADGAMQDADDLDGDFVGNACETSCETRLSPRCVAYYPVSVGGQCCTVTYPGDAMLLDPDGLPLRIECPDADDGVTCRRLPPAAAFAPGVVSLPSGCELALAEAGLTVQTHQPLRPEDVGGIDELWTHMCTLPPPDEDFDGILDVCDLCPHAFDPSNALYVDDGGVVWSGDGQYCNGAYTPESCEG